MTLPPPRPAPSSPPPPLRLTVDGDALASNWRWLAAQGGGAACGAAVKADGYGLGATAVIRRLAEAGCRDFFVASWAEAAALGPWPDGLSLAVLHGLREEDLAFALAHPARPVLNSIEQVARWRAAGGGACDVMIDTGMNRLGFRPEEAGGGALDGIAIDTLMSHLACADEPGHPMSARQRDALLSVSANVPSRRLSLANSAGICLGPDYGFDLTRPGLALYGGVPHPAAAGHIAQVARIEAQIVQKRVARAGETVGYGATHLARADEPLVILNLGYADGYLRGFSGRGSVLVQGEACPIVGRVSMDLIAAAVPRAGWSTLAEGDWIEIAFDLPEAARVSGLSQYELLTAIGHRYQRRWS